MFGLYLSLHKTALTPFGSSAVRAPTTQSIFTKIRSLVFRESLEISIPPSTTKGRFNIDKMAPNNLPAALNATSQDLEMLLAAQSHLGSKNLQVHMEPYLWKTRADGVNVLNAGKTWYESFPCSMLLPRLRISRALESR